MLLTLFLSAFIAAGLVRLPCFLTSLFRLILQRFLHFLMSLQAFLDALMFLTFRL